MVWKTRTVYEWRYTQSNYHLFKFDMDLTNGYLNQGEFTFPFDFTVPASAPSQFQWSRGADYAAEIKYLVTARYGAAADHETMYVSQRIPDGYRGSNIAQTSHVKCCLCIDKGVVKINSSFEKDAYVPGETVRVLTAVDNSQSKVGLGNIKAEADLHIQLYSHGRTHREKIDAGETVAQGLDVGQTTGGKIPMQFNLQASPMMPSTFGRLVRAEYIVKVQAPALGCCICSTPQTQIPIVVGQKPRPKRVFKPPQPTFKPKPMQVHNFVVPEEPNPPKMQYNPAQMINPVAPVIQPVIIQPVMMEGPPPGQPGHDPNQQGVPMQPGQAMPQGQPGVPGQVMPQGQMMAPGQVAPGQVAPMNYPAPPVNPAGGNQGGPLG